MIKQKNARFFLKPSEMVEYIQEWASQSDYISELQGTLGWCEMEDAMFLVLKRMADGKDDWNEPVNLGVQSSVVAYDPDIGVANFADYYFDIDRDMYFLKAHTILKLHRNIHRREL